MQISRRSSNGCAAMFVRGGIFVTHEPQAGRAIHAIGNGSILAYGRGIEWVQVFGPPYSSPTLISLLAEGVFSCQSLRLPQSNLWEHRIPQGKIVECAPHNPNCLLRAWQLLEALPMELRFAGREFAEQTALFPGIAWAGLFVAPACTPYYNDYPSGARRYMMITFTGGAHVETLEGALRIVFQREGCMRVSGAETYPACVEAMECALATAPGEIFRAAQMEDRAFCQRRLARMPILRSHPLANVVREASEGVAFLIRAQQAQNGGILAGHNYHLSYVRDQYGTFRGLLAMGCQEEAEAIVKFSQDVFLRSGRLANAQGIGVPNSFHEHENDSVEITGYLLLQSIKLLEATGNREFFDEQRPMLDWALRSQLRQLHQGMLPFNGDETYVAGGFVPRTALNHGSFEATMLFIEGGKRYLSMRHAGKSEDWLCHAKEALANAERQFERNFRRGNSYIANSLLRLNGLVEPAYRHGMCANGDTFGWLKRVNEGIYVCPHCLAKHLSPPACKREIALKSALMMALYVDSPLLSLEYLRSQTGAYLAQYRQTGVLPSLPDGSRCVGYDFGLLLYAAARLGLAADDLLAHMLALKDGAGMWAEYYDGGQPQNTRCRPWESAINMEGALQYLCQQPKNGG